MPVNVPETDLRAVLDLVVRQQQSRSTACAYLGTARPQIEHDLGNLDQPWAETVRTTAGADGSLTGAVAIEWDEDLDRSWVHGPWTEDAASWDAEAAVSSSA